MARGALHVLLAGGMALVALAPLWAPARVPCVPRPLAIDLAHDPPARLALLPGVGPQRARALAEHRQQHGAPHSLQALAAVPALGPARAAALAATRLVRLTSAGLPLQGAGTAPAPPAARAAPGPPGPAPR
ncbi:MAG: helix-hairpin-helix domain-containing protein [Planctomycetia bacterium]